MQWRTLWGEHRKPTVILLGVLLVAVVLDFALRVMVWRDESLREFTKPSTAPLPTLDTPQAVTERLRVWFPAEPEQQQAAPVERTLVLQGIFGSGAEARAAIALVPSDGSVAERLRVTVGQTVDGWTVERIERRKVFLKKDAQSRELVLFRVPTE